MKERVPKNFVFSHKDDDRMDPRVRPEDDNLKKLFLFVIPAGIRREST